MKSADIKSDFFILDVKKGRKKLAKHIASGGKLIVFCMVEIDTQHSADDGTSIEFSGRVIRMGGA